MLFTAILPIFPRASADFENTHTNTGNQIEDLIAVAMTQVGYTEGENNDTKYCDWMGYPNQAWCAMFITWCADQAELPPSVMDPSAWAHPRSGRGFGVPYYHGTEYTPKRGDLFFKEDFSHVGIVYGVEGEYALTIEANTNDDGSAEGYGVLLRKRKISESYFGLPQYTHCPDDHEYTIKYESGHPHRRYYYCSTCKKAFYTGGLELVTSCINCVSSKCLTARRGYFTVTQSSGRLRVYDSHYARYAVGYLDPGEMVYVYATDNEWGHILYGSTPGCVKMSSLKRFVYTPTDFASSFRACYDTEPIDLSWSPSPSARSYILTVLQDGEALFGNNVGNVTSYTLTDLAAGHYQLELRANDNYANSAPVSIDLTVLPTYSITFDPCGGTDAPQKQTKNGREAFLIPEQVPVRVGFVFLGWSTEADAKTAAYGPGALFRQNEDTTLYAVWQKADAVPTALEVLTPPPSEALAAGQMPNTEGMQLLLTYDDGTARIITEGYTLDPPPAFARGNATVTVCYEGLRAYYKVAVLPCCALESTRALITETKKLLP